MRTIKFMSRVSMIPWFPYPSGFSFAFFAAALLIFYDSLFKVERVPWKKKTFLEESGENL